MSEMFRKVGFSNPNFELDLGDNFSFDKVINMKSMFSSTYIKTLKLNQTSFNSNVDLTDIFIDSPVVKNIYVKTQSDKDLLDSKGFSNINVLVG